MNFSITISGEGPELGNALKTLKEIIGSNQIGTGLVATTIEPAAPVQQPFPQAPVAPPQQPNAPLSYPQDYQQPQTQQPYQAPMQPPVQTPMQSPVQPQGAVPTAGAPSYSIEQLGVAAGPLVDAGRGPELTGWLNQRGAGALTQLDKAYYGEFATYLRSLGARI